MIAVTGDAGRCSSGCSTAREQPAAREAAGRHVRGVHEFVVAVLVPPGVRREFHQALTKQFIACAGHACARNGCVHPADHPRARHARLLDHVHVRTEMLLRKISRRGRHLRLAGVLRLLHHAIARPVGAGRRAAACAAFHFCNLADDVGRREPCERGVLRAALARRRVAEAAGVDIWCAAARHHGRHRGVRLWKPVGRRKQVVELRFGVRDAALRHVQWLELVEGRRLRGRRRQQWVEPGRRNEGIRHGHPGAACKQHDQCAQHELRHLLATPQDKAAARNGRLTSMR